MAGGVSPNDVSPLDDVGGPMTAHSRGVEDSMQRAQNRNGTTPKLPKNTCIVHSCTQIGLHRHFHAETQYALTQWPPLT